MLRIFPMLLGLLPLWAVAQTLQSPGEFLPYELGETFTPHHLLVDYYQYVAGNSPNVELIEYGRTNEDRPLLLAFVSTPENLRRLDEIRQNNLRRAGLLDGAADASLDRAIVWLSFSVHGNEAAGSEASMGVLYDLANTSDARTQDWLRNTIVILDPSLNPDGYSRYTHWYRGVANRLPNPDPLVREHREPWPGGRVNHYLFDLNRDWAWQTQVETRQRIERYRQWMPHVHADLHEQYYDSPYYFAPAARPYHRYITEWQGDFQTEIGMNHAKYFDQNAWLYFTKEVFDLFYPSYGDTYPVFNGAIGMTYEQGGHSRGGRAIFDEIGDTLTLHDRVLHHRTTALSTVETASNNADRLVQNFSDYFSQSRNNPKGEYRSYIIKGANARGRLRALTELLDRNGIQYGRAGSRSSTRGYSYQEGREVSVTVDPDDLVISAYQPLSVLTQVLFDPAAELEDSLTYDITAWALPYAYGLESYAATQRIDPQAGGYPLSAYQDRIGSLQNTYAYAVRWDAMDDARFLAQLLQAGIKVRSAGSAFSSGGQDFNAGTLLITRADNLKLQDFESVFRNLVREYEADVFPVTTGFSTRGPDVGSDAMRYIKAPKVAVISGESTNSNEFGQVWHYFEQVLEYPIYVLGDEDLGGNLSDYDVLVLPEGRFDINESVAGSLASWVRNGGKLIAIGDALNSLAGKSGFGLQQKEGQPSDTAQNDGEDARLLPYAGQDRRDISNITPGAIFKNRLDNTHPLGYGLPDYYFSLKTNTLAFSYLDDGWNVATVGKNPQTSGFVGSRAFDRLQETISFAVEPKGQGQVIYMVDNPLFRGFWENGKFLFSNALFMVQ